jgi:hypothetical protein
LEGYISKDIISYPYIPKSPKRIFTITWAYALPDIAIGRIYQRILYPILISPRSAKNIFLITFWRGIFRGYNILILGGSKLYIQYPFLEKISNYGVL